MKLNVQTNLATKRNNLKLADIKVPEALKHRKCSGISWFDNVVSDGNPENEGMVPSSVMMLTGTPGAGKTTLLLQLADSLVNSGHAVLYNTGEESLFQVKMVADRLGLESSFYASEFTLLPDLLSHSDDLRKKNPGKNFFLLQDSLQTLDDGKYTNGHVNNATALRATEGMASWAKENFTNVIFIGQVNKSGEFSGKNAILHAIDVRGKIYVDLDKKSESFGERCFSVTKNRFGCNGQTVVLGMGTKGLYEKGGYSFFNSEE